VLEAAGYQVEVPGGGSECCGLTWLSTGQLDAARRQLLRSLDALTPAIEADLPVVVLEPSCAAVFRDDALDLLPDHPMARAAAGAVCTLAELLERTPGWSPPDLSGVRGVVQPHCHHHAVLGWATDAALLDRAGARLVDVGGCCGLAGNWGVEAGHYDVSVAIANNSLLPALRNAGPDAPVLADGFSCRTQIAELDGRRARHLAEVLAEHLD
jgi:Fe-S oxidoreductase